MCYGYDGHTALCESMERRGTSRRSLPARCRRRLAGRGGPRDGGGSGLRRRRSNQWQRVPPGKISIQLYTRARDLGGRPASTPR